MLTLSEPSIDPTFSQYYTSMLKVLIEINPEGREMQTPFDSKIGWSSGDGVCM